MKAIGRTYDRGSRFTIYNVPCSTELCGELYTISKGTGAMIYENRDEREFFAWQVDTVWLMWGDEKRDLDLSTEYIDQYLEINVSEIDLHAYSSKQIDSGELYNGKNLNAAKVSPLEWTYSMYLAYKDQSMPWDKFMTRKESYTSRYMK